MYLLLVDNHSNKHLNRKRKEEGRKETLGSVSRGEEKDRERATWDRLGSVRKVHKTDNRTEPIASTTSIANTYIIAHAQFRYSQHFDPCFSCSLMGALSADDTTTPVTDGLDSSSVDMVLLFHC